MCVLQEMLKARQMESELGSAVWQMKTHLVRAMTDGGFGGVVRPVCFGSPPLNKMRGGKKALWMFLVVRGVGPKNARGEQFWRFSKNGDQG